MEKPGQRAASSTLRLGTRGSLLAIAQSRLIAVQLEAASDHLHVELIRIRTTGDRVTDRPLADIGGKGLFTKELEQALLARTIDVAVHSYKDLPITMPLVDQSHLLIASVPKRADPRDVLVGHWSSISELPHAARIGTGSLRRQCQLLASRADLLIQPIRGNIDTRLRRLAAGEFEAIVLAKAGLERAGLFNESTMRSLDVERMLPAAGQGALALQCRSDDGETIQILRSLNDPETMACVNLEREIVRLLNGDCHSPIAAFASIEADEVRLRVAMGQAGGNLPIVRSDSSLPRDQCEKLPSECVRLLS